MNDMGEELRAVLNCHSVENDSNTPDFILAELLGDVLEAFAKAVQARDRWYHDARWEDDDG